MSNPYESPTPEEQGAPKRRNGLALMMIFGLMVVGALLVTFLFQSGSSNVTQQAVPTRVPLQNAPAEPTEAGPLPTTENSADTADN